MGQVLLAPGDGGAQGVGTAGSAQAVEDDLDEAEKLADRILILVGGTIVADGSAAELSAELSGAAEVRFSREGEFFVHSVEDATGFLRGLFAQYGDAIGDLEVRRARLPEVYLTLVREFESGQRTEAPSELTEVTA